MQRPLLFALAILATLAVSTQVTAQTPMHPSALSPTADPLAPIIWMTGSWRAETPTSGEGHAITIEQRISSILGGKAVAFSTTFDGVQRYQGLFAYDAARKAIVFWYPSASGELTTGTVSPQDGYLLLEFQVTDNEGATTPFQVHIKPAGADGYNWTLYGRTDSDWKAMLSLQYHRVGN